MGDEFYFDVVDAVDLLHIHGVVQRNFLRLGIIQKISGINVGRGELANLNESPTKLRMLGFVPHPNLRERTAEIDMRAL